MQDFWFRSVFIGKSVYMTIGGLDVESTRAIERLPSNRQARDGYRIQAMDVMTTIR